MKGGPRPGAGRPRRPDPTTAEEAARELARYGVAAYVTPAGNVGMEIPAAVALLAKLRRRKPATAG